MSIGRKLHVHNGHGATTQGGLSQSWGQRWELGAGRRPGQLPRVLLAKVGNFPISVPCHSQVSSSRCNPNGRRSALWLLWPSLSLLVDPEGFNESD